MISAWKKLISRSPNDDANGLASNHGNKDGVITMPPGVHKLDKELQRKFARGINYNMKVVIRGDTQVGKTSLFLRLKGYGFQEEYTPTESLNVTSIDWSYKATDDVVKIDLWEAVDSASKRSVNFVDLKTETETNPNGVAQSYPKPTNGTNQTNVDIPSTTTKVTVTSTKLHPAGSDSHNGNLPSFIPESAKQSLAELSEHFDVYRGSNAVLLVMDMTKSWTFKYIQNELLKIPKQIPVLVVANHRDQGHHRTVAREQVEAFINAQTREPCDGILMYTEASMKNGFGMRVIENFFNIPFLKLQELSLLKQLELNRHEFLATREELSFLVESTHKDYEQYLELQTIKRRQAADAMSPINKGLVQLDETTREQIRSTRISSDMIDKRMSNAKSIEYDNAPKSSVSPNHQSFINDRLPSIVIGAKCPLPDIKSNNANQQIDDHKITGICEKDEDESEEEEVRANPLVADYQSDLDSDDQLDR